jgi:uncharacterized protein (DUF2147 family)
LPLRLPVLALSALTLGSLTFTTLPARSDSDPSGVWLTQAGDARVQVSRCGGGICGKIVWLRDPIDPKTGKPQVDDKNPSPALAQRPIIGLTIFSGMQPVNGNKWSGRIYNADDGQSYSSNITLQSNAALEVQGCVGGVLCGSETWTRVSGAPAAASAAKKKATPAAAN